MTESESVYSDKPILEPTNDRFGINPFARTLATSIQKIKAPEGTVIALNGPWGSGKSSAVNLIRYHLKDAAAADEIAVINFACWWFRGEEALALAFFRELYAGLGPSLGDRFKKVLPKIGARLLRGGSMVSAGADLTGATAGAGALASGAMNWLSDLIHADDTVEKLHGELTKVLSDQKKRFLIVIDDIDRLAPDEAMLIFRLVKSIGRLPNVVYLLVFDRSLAEAIVSERYPSEGPHYLEKIIQAGFDIPPPRQADLSQEFLRNFENLCGAPKDDDLVRFMNVFYDVVMPEIRTPRDLIRLTNALAVTWPAVGVEVDRADFVGMETLRLFQPDVYRSLRAQQDLVCGVDDSLGRQERDKAGGADRVLFGGPEHKHRDRLRRALMRLFPRLESVWGNLHYGEGSGAEWSRHRRVCSPEHFDSYFRFAIGENVVPRNEIDAMVARASDGEFIKGRVREALESTRKDGKTRAALLLDELNVHAERVADEDVEPLLVTLFALGDEVNVVSDTAGPFGMGDNQLRIHWLLRRLTLERFSLERRSAIFVVACQHAALGWLIDFVSSAFEDYHPRDGKDPECEQKCLTTSADADALRNLALKRIREASTSDELTASSRLAYILFRWRDLAADDGAEVKAWAAEQMRCDAMIAVFAKAFTSYSWSQGLGMAGLGDLVAKRTTRANVRWLDQVLDKVAFRERIEEMDRDKKLSGADSEAIREFLEAWRRHDKNPRD